MVDTRASACKHARVVGLCGYMRMGRGCRTSRLLLCSIVSVTNNLRFRDVEKASAGRERVAVSVIILILMLRPFVDG